MSETTTEVIELSLEKVIETKLVQSNVTEQILVGLKQKYGDLRLKSLEDKESYLELKAAAKDCAKVRTLTVKLCKEGRERAVKEQKLWIAKEKEIVGRVDEVESVLDAEIAKFDNEVKRKEEEEKKRQEEAYINRQAVLTKMGAEYNSGCFILGAASFEADLVKNASNDVWEESIVPRFQEEFEKIEAVRIEEENKRKQEEARIKEEQEKLLKQQEELRLQQEEFAKKQAEAERLEREKKDAEEAQKRKEQQELQSKRFEQMFPYANSGESVDMNTLWCLAESDFNDKLGQKKAAFEKDEQEKEALAEQKRLNDIEAAKQEAIRKEQERIEEEKVKRQQELDASNDKTKWDEVINYLKKCPSFEMRSGQYRKRNQILLEKLQEIYSL